MSAGKSIVHGDIRHLEKTLLLLMKERAVHGDIRHLEKLKYVLLMATQVHGDIRHLERITKDLIDKKNSSWRHTPFRNKT